MDEYCYSNLGAIYANGLFSRGDICSSMDIVVCHRAVFI